MANKVIYFGVCVDNQDPALSGRIRAVLDSNWEGKTPKDYDADQLEALLSTEAGNPDLIKKYGSGESGVQKLKWSENDPHLCSPFLPAFINIIPQTNENVKIILYDPDNPTQNKEYVGPSISSPSNYPYQQFAGGRQGTSKGNRVKRDQNITDSDISTNTFAYPDKIALDGRNNSDLIFGDSEVLLRAGKFISNPKTPEFPVFNPQMSTLQITNYPSKLTLEEKEITKEIVEEVDIKYLVEYEIFNLESETTFDGKITLYEILSNPPLVSLPTSVGVGLTTEIYNTKARVTLNFQSQFVSGATYLIDNFLNEVDGRDNTSLKTGPFEGINWTKSAGDGDDIINIGTSASSDEALNLYPFYFRPSLEFQKELDVVNPNDSGVVQERKKLNAQQFTKDIRLIGVNGDKHYGLKISRDQSTNEIKKETTKIDEAKLDETTREGIINAISNKILLYSHDSSIADKEKRNPLVENTNNAPSGDNMGVDQKTQITLNDKEMEPVVRGDQLVKVLTMIVDYLGKHEHGLPGTAPFNETKSGPTLKEVEKILQDKNFLNQNIRIN